MSTNVKDKKYYVKDVNAELVALAKSVNVYTDQLKNRNLVGKNRTKVMTARKDVLRNMLFVVSAGIVNGVIEQDKYKLLQASAPKTLFKDVVDINGILSDLMVEMSKTPVEGMASLSITELAKMVKSPYHFDESLSPKGDNKSQSDVKASDIKATSETVDCTDVPEIDGESVVNVTGTDGVDFVIDKENGHIYVSEDDEHPCLTDAPVTKISVVSKVTGKVLAGYAWLRASVCKMFSVTWNFVKSIASAIMTGITYIGSLIMAGGVWVYDTVRGWFKAVINKFKKDDGTEVIEVEEVEAIDVPTNSVPA